MDARENAIVFEQDGYLWMMRPVGSRPKKLAITVHGDFPWAYRALDGRHALHRVRVARPNGKRALFEARGEIFTVPVEKGDARNLTRSSGAADRRARVVAGRPARRVVLRRRRGYRLLIGNGDGLGTPRAIAIGDAKMAWSPRGRPTATTSRSSTTRCASAS
jgi:tricorn protease